MKIIHPLLYLITVFAVFSSCSPKLQPDQKSNAADKIFYPKNADTAHFQYLKGISTNKDIEKQSRFEESVIGASKLEFMSKPYGITVEKSKIYVADIGLKGLNIIDLETESFTQFKPFHKDLTFVLSAFVDTNDDRYILDSKTATIMVFDNKGKLKYDFKVPENERPSRIRIKGDRIYISDLATKRINIYSKETHQWIDQIPKKDVIVENDDFVYMPMDFDLDDEFVYILDAGAYKVKVYDHEANLVKSFGGQGNGYGLFNRPKSIAVDREGNILVVDSTTRLVQVFNREGQALLSFGFPYQIEEDKWAPGIMFPTSMAIDYNNNDYFKQFVDSRYRLKYVVYVVNQTGGKNLMAYGRIELK
ncbi:hypothetical protein [Lutimonas vermicola]|uniref:6-bladed beta-propeller n=1 Tax=Lutimonas vermicola TaxID=414288 RepID=A0ABU9KYD0_9FLAO